MIIDTSALVAILGDEAEAATFSAKIDGAKRASVSSGTWVEFGTVLVRKFRIADCAPVLDAYARRFRLVIVPLTAEQSAIAVAGYAAFGRGTGHRAGLNFGDCFSYALAKATGEPLLFKGDDFAHTDIVAAL